jgi:hypothetical protein
MLLQLLCAHCQHHQHQLRKVRGAQQLRTQQPAFCVPAVPTVFVTICAIPVACCTLEQSLPNH